MNERLNKERHRQSLSSEKLLAYSPKQSLLLAGEKYKQLSQSLFASMSHGLDKHKQQLAQQAEKLNLVSPLATLQRGYAITSNEQGNVITSKTQVTSGQVLNVKVSDGDIKVKVDEV